MIDANKVRIMTKLAAFEKEEEKSIKIAKYYQIDFVRGELLKSFVYVTMGYVCILVLLGIANIEHLVNYVTWQYIQELAGKIIIGYVILLAVYLFVGAIAYQRQYRKAKRKVKEYDRLLHLLRQMYRKEQGKNN